MLDQRGRLLVVTLEAARLRLNAHPLPALRSWLDSWRGIGAVTVGMHRQGYDLQLTQYDERGWRATFYVTGMEHTPTSATGTWVAEHAVDARDGMGIGTESDAVVSPFDLSRWFTFGGVAANLVVR